MTGSVDSALELQNLRTSIDNIDAAMVRLLADRFRCAHAVGRLKAQLGLASRDAAREAEQISRIRQLAVASDLEPGFAERFLRVLLEEAVRCHDLQRAGNDESRRSTPEPKPTHGLVAASGKNSPLSM